VNTGYILWFGALVVVTGATLLWLAIGSVPEVQPDPGPPEPGEPDEREPETRAAMRGEAAPASGPEAASASWPESAPGPASEAAGEDGIAGPA
jgi:hypothetical protein